MKLKEGEVRVVCDEDMERLERQNIKHLRSFPNPHRVGTKDKWLVAIIPDIGRRHIVEKTVEYSYPTSPNADRLGFKKGCWSVSINNFAICGFTTQDAAKKYADSLEAIPYGKYTL